MPLSKPGPWSVNPADIDLRYLDLWRGLVALYPLWETAAERAFDVVGHTRGVAGNAGVGIQVSQVGIERTFQAATGWGIKIATFAEWETIFAGQPNATFWVIARYITDASGRRIFSSGTATASTTNVNLGTDASNTARFQVRVGGTGVSVAGGTLAGNLYFNYFGVVRNGSVFVYVASADGITTPFQLGASDTSQAGNTIDWDQSSENVALGGVDGDSADSNRNLNGGVIIAAAWTRALSEADMRRLVRDPFGMIRPELFVSAEVADPTTVNLFVRKSRRHVPRLG